MQVLSLLKFGCFAWKLCRFSHGPFACMFWSLHMKSQAVMSILHARRVQLFCMHVALLLTWFFFMHVVLSEQQALLLIEFRCMSCLLNGSFFRCLIAELFTDGTHLFDLSRLLLYRQVCVCLYVRMYVCMYVCLSTSF